MIVIAQITANVHFCRKNRNMRIFVAKVTTYVYFCRENQNICALLERKTKHTRIQIFCIIEEFCTLLKKKKCTLHYFAQAGIGPLMEP